MLRYSGMVEPGNPKLEAPNYTPISNFHPVESCLWQVRQRRNSTGLLFNDQNSKQVWSAGGGFVKHPGYYGTRFACSVPAWLSRTGRFLN